MSLITGQQSCSPLHWDAAGDLVAEQLGFGYLTAGAIFGGLIALITLSYYAFRLNAVVAFWLAYILTRPLGASIGDGLTQKLSAGGLGLRTMQVSGAFLVVIVALVIYLTIKERDAPLGRDSIRR